MELLWRICVVFQALRRLFCLKGGGPLESKLRSVYVMLSCQGLSLRRVLFSQAQYQQLLQ